MRVHNEVFEFDGASNHRLFPFQRNSLKTISSDHIWVFFEDTVGQGRDFILDASIIDKEIENGGISQGDGACRCGLV